MAVLWSASSFSKQFGERIILYYTVLWISVMAVIVKMRLYESFQANDYLKVGVTLSFPCILLPLILADKKERHLNYFERYIVKANIFIAILSYLGNHFFTHYFYNILGMRYTGPLAVGFKINAVPVSMYFMTHVYFLSYHILVTPLLRAVVNIFSYNTLIQYIMGGGSVIVLSILTAFLETYTISSFPYYTYPDYYSMLTTGSVFYSMFFVVSFPAFYFIDEQETWSVGHVIITAFGCMMIIMLLADIWRLVLGQVMNKTVSMCVPYAV